MTQPLAGLRADAERVAALHSAALPRCVAIRSRVRSHMGRSRALRRCEKSLAAADTAAKSLAATAARCEELLKRRVALEAQR